MSKELAQTVGGKRTAWLLAILAAFAVFATVATQWRGASAVVTGTDFVIDEYDTAEVPPAPENVDLASPFPDPDVIGATRWYKISIMPLTQATLGDLQVTASIDELIIAANPSNIGGSNASCSFVNSFGDGTVTCTWEGPIPLGASGTIILQTQVNDLDGSGFSVGAWYVQGNDLGSGQGAIDGVDQVSGFDISRPNVDLNKTNSASPVAGGNVTYTITVSNTDDASLAAEVDALNVHVLDTIDPTDHVAVQSVSASGGTINTCSGVGTLPDTSSPWNIDCNIGTLAVGATATVTIVATLATPDPGTNELVTNCASTTFTNSTLVTIGGDPCTDFLIFGEDIVFPVLDPGLYHVTADGLDLAGYRDDPNNLIGFVHQVCLVPDGQSEIGFPLDGIIPPSVATGDESDYFWRIVNISGTPSVTGQAQVELDFPQYENGTDLPCVRWYSSGPGEQEVTVVNGAGEVIANWFGSDDAFDSGDVVDAYEPLVKEWNVLDPTFITDFAPEVGDDGLGDAIPAGENLDGDTINVGAVFNPATSEFEGDITFWENVLGSHQSVGGPVPPVGDMLWVDGALVTFTISGACGAAWVDDNYISVDGDDDVTVTSMGQPIPFEIVSDGCTNADLSTTTVTISVDYPTNIGSISPVPPADETITVHWTTTRPTKDVFLAWSGQRVLLEHDWRLPPGDTNTSTRNEYDADGICPFESFDVDYVRGSGPGNFVAGLGASQWPSGWRDGATVEVSGDNDQSGDAPTDPQGACISRVIYESEDQGQVDIEAFIDVDGSDNQTKIAFVIYYMKIEKVAVSLVTGNEDGAALVEKPKHNATGSDFAPGNPWRADNDLTAASQNVSTDVLVRVQVKGWFTTSNPSGRERDASDPNNVLPQDRWVMPDDWARLIAGGAGIDFRPEYDYMFAPNNTRGITLDVPDGTGAVLVTKVATSSSNTTTSLKVESLAQLPVGAQIKVGSLSNTTRTVTAVNTDTNVITTSGAVASSTPAAGASVWVVSGTPFEGPFSLIDIQDGATGQGLYGQGFGSAALSNIVTGAVRDTRNGDQVLDWYDAPMPPAPVTVDIRKAGFLKQVLKKDVYYTGTADSSTQDYPNPYYYSNIPESPYLPSSVAGGSFLWDSWGNDGPQGNGQGAYEFWEAVRIGVGISGNAGETLTTAQQTELSEIRTVYGDPTVARRLLVFSDNHGEAMVIANGDFNLTYDECAANLLGGGKHCDTGDLVGASDIFATADYPDFRGKHAPVRSNTATIDWTWGGFKDVTIEPGEVEQYVYVVFRALDRDGFCGIPSTGTVSLHPVLSSWDDDFTFSKSGSDPVEAIDFLIDSDEGGIIVQTSAGTGAIDVTREATDEGGIPTYSTAASGRSETASDSTRKFAPLTAGTDECQAWVKLSNSLLGVTNVLVFAHDDEGLIGFDKIVDFTDTVDYTLNFRWSLITWLGADNIPPLDALSGTGANDGGTDILDQVTAVYGWEASSQSWLAFFPDGIDIPGANDLTGLRTGNAYWIAIKGPSSITWSVVTDVD